MIAQYQNKLIGACSRPVIKVSFYLRKMLNSKSVQAFPDYTSYKRALFASKKIQWVQCIDPTSFIDMVDDRVRSRKPVETSDWANYARICVDMGESQRFLAQTGAIPVKSWRNQRIRTNYFIALITLGEYDRALSFVDESLANGWYDAAFLMRALGDAYLLDDAKLSCNLAKVVEADFGKELSLKHRIFVANLASLAGHRDVVGGISYPASTRDTDVDLLLYQSNIAHLDKRYADQLLYLNAALAKYEMRPVEIADFGKPVSVANLMATQASSNAQHGPLVTIAMSTFNSAGTVISALRALSAQDYQNIEVLVVDDCSSDNTVGMVTDYANNVDGRVRIIRREANGGTYLCRNQALHEGHGEYFVCNDSDDWAHPQRISSLVETLRSSPGAIAAHARLLRLSDTMGVKPKKDGYCHDDQSSLMYRRTDLMESLGYYLPSKFGADSEFTARIRRRFGESSIIVVDKPVLLSDWSRSSLSGAITTGITDGGTFATARRKFRREYMDRHNEVDSLYVPLTI